jgi:hypothetical protein
MIIKIAKSDERKAIAGILVENGYKVSIVKIKVGKATRIALEVVEGDNDNG